ncbi:hypothetical protein GF373_16115, partial [bacterium]|nr:hypothetical protein [bacterium]
MKTRTLLLLLIPIFLFLTPSFAQDWLAGEKISLKQNGGAITVSLPFENTSEEPFVGDISISLLDKNYKSQAEVFKKLFVVNGRHVEQIALPIPQGYNDRPLVRIDFEDQIWIKRPDPQAFDREMHIIGQKEWLSGSVATIRVIVTQSLKNEPLENVVVNAKLYAQGKDEPVKTAEQATDQSGNAALKFDIDDKISGKYRLVITSEANEQTDKVESSIEVLPGRKIFLVSDKPVYQPGQVMHLRALAAHKSDDRPIAGEEVTLEVFDGKGNKVFKKPLQTSDYGIVSADFQLADEVNQGDYAIKALMGDDVTEKTVNVYEYVLPKFKVSVKNEKDFYLPGDTVEGTVEARYFFGKPLDGAHVKLVANCFDVGFNAFETVEGETDKEGKYKYTFTIPKRLVGQPSFQGKSIIQMDVRVRDTADHEEQKIHTFHVAEQPLQFEVLPESGRLVAGVENEMFIVASRPDGSVAKPKVDLRSQYIKKQTVQCDENGIASVFITPDAELKQQEHFPLT